LSRKVAALAPEATHKAIAAQITRFIITLFPSVALAG
jgi:hypothetical protein